MTLPPECLVEGSLPQTWWGGLLDPYIPTRAFWLELTGVTECGTLLDASRTPHWSDYHRAAHFHTPYDPVVVVLMACAWTYIRSVVQAGARRDAERVLDHKEIEAAIREALGVTTASR